MYFNIQLQLSPRPPALCIEYDDVKADLASLGWTLQLNRDYGADGVNMSTGTIRLRSKNLFGSAQFEMPLNGAGPYCLSYITVGNYDLGLPSFLR